MSAFLDNTQINYVFFLPLLLLLSLSLYLEKGGAQQKEEKPSPLFISLFFCGAFFLEEGDEVQREREGGLRDSVVVIRLEEEYRDLEVYYICRSCRQYRCVKTAPAQRSFQNGHQYQPGYKENLYYWLFGSL